MARMLARMSPPQCCICRTPPGPDCPEVGLSKRQAKSRERAELRKMLRDMEGDPMLVLGSDC